MKICLNGIWLFQPIAVADNYTREKGVPPCLPRPDEQKWEETPIRIPSPWNGNTWGNGRVDRNKENQQYNPDSVYYPNYPAAWDTVEMGWLRRSFTVPDGWENKRISLLFEAVMGETRVYVNGREAGRHFDGYLPFELNITDAVKPGENTLEVGVRRLHLFDKQSEKYKKMRTPYPHGSNTMGLGGIWQDVWLLAKPKAYISDVFVKPYVNTNTLEMEITVNNETDETRRITLKGGVYNKAGERVMSMPPRILLLRSGLSLTVDCKESVGHKLALWSPDAPHLYTVKWEIDGEDDYIHETRFGWRQFLIQGRDLLLNGSPIHLVGDICHPFGPHMFMQAHIVSWYNLIKSVGGNAVRLHAQIHPKLFLDTADEMGIVVMDETAIFGSCIALNFEEDIAWQRYEAHFDGMIFRDRNHPSVFSWSFGNELFAIFLYDEAAKRDEDGMYARLFELGNRARLLDPTRDFVTCDGDEDLRNTLPVWSKHFGHGIHHLPTDINKPLVVGENGGTYYATPGQLSAFNGQQAYESYAGRNTALGIDLYNNIRHFGDALAYFSPSELVWFGLQQLPFGYSDFDRLPDLSDGIFFTDCQEGQPGIYVGRIPPYTGTLNPGFDANLPEYIPLDMYHGMKDALTFSPDLDKEWAIRNPVVDLPQAPLPQGEITFIEIHDEADLTQLPYPAVLTQRKATQLKKTASHPWVDGLNAADLYFAEKEDKYVMHHGLTGEIVEKGHVLLAAGDTDWSLFNNRPECAKCGAIALYEQINKPNGAALVVLPYGGNTWVITTLRRTPDTAVLFNHLQTAMGLTPTETVVTDEKGKTEHDLLLHGPMERSE